MLNKQKEDWLAGEQRERWVDLSKLGNKRASVYSYRPTTHAHTYIHTSIHHPLSIIHPYVVSGREPDKVTVLAKLPSSAAGLQV